MMTDQVTTVKTSERMLELGIPAEKVAQIFEQFMSGVFQGDTPKKMAEEFKQKPKE